MGKQAPIWNLFIQQAWWHKILSSQQISIKQVWPSGEHYTQSDNARYLLLERELRFVGFNKNHWIATAKEQRAKQTKVLQRSQELESAFSSCLKFRDKMNIRQTFFVSWWRVSLNESRGSCVFLRTIGVLRQFLSCSFSFVKIRFKKKTMSNLLHTWPLVFFLPTTSAVSTHSVLPCSEVGKEPTVLRAEEVLSIFDVNWINGFHFSHLTTWTTQPLQIFGWKYVKII